MRLFKLFVLITTILTLAAPIASAKDLTDRLGVGYNAEFSTSGRTVPALSAKYGLSKDLHLAGAVGFNTQTPSQFVMGAKLFKNIFYETNLNFYLAGGAAYIKDTKSAVEFLGVLGAEFFLPGLDSLGLLFEAGISANNVGGSFGIKTVGFSFLQAGMHFYF